MRDDLVAGYNRLTNELEIYSDHLTDDPPIWTGASIPGELVRELTLVQDQGALAFLVDNAVAVLVTGLKFIGD
jgi:hypothetical protein